MKLTKQQVDSLLVAETKLDEADAKRDSLKIQIEECTLVKENLDRRIEALMTVSKQQVENLEVAEAKLGEVVWSETL